VFPVFVQLVERELLSSFLGRENRVSIMSELVFGLGISLKLRISRMRIFISVTDNQFLRRLLLCSLLSERCLFVFAQVSDTLCILYRLLRRLIRPNQCVPMSK